ncbi:MAG TPA: DMT family transporter [Arenicellales bacterium]|nr:DMT family transporter [Arenicellales bacterium]
MNHETRGMLYGLLGVTAFGLTLPITRFVTPYLDPVFIGLGRAVLAALVAAALLLVTRQRLPAPRQLGRLLVVGLGVVIGFPVLSAWAMQTAPASHGGVVLGILPLATAVASMFVSNDRPSIGFWLFGILGSALVVAYALIEGVGRIQAADLALLGAVVSAAVGYAVGGDLSRRLGGWQVICWALVLMLPVIAAPAWWHMPDTLAAVPLPAWTGFLYLALVSQLYGFFWWNRGLALGGVARVSQIQLLQPFITLAASVAVLQEVITFETGVFAVLVVVVVALGRRMPIYKKEADEAAPRAAAG